MPAMSDSSATAIAEQVNAAIATEFEIDAGRLTPEARLVEDLGLDSLDSVDLIAAMERSFKVKCPEEQARQLRTVGDIHRFVERLLAARAGAAVAVSTGAVASPVATSN